MIRPRTWMALLPACLAGCGATPVEAVAISARGLARELVAHWSFDEQSGTTAADRSGNGHDGQLTLTGGGTWVTGGRFGGGLRLQAGDSVTIPAFPPATLDWTVSVWINLTDADRAAFASQDRAVLLTAETRMGGWEMEFDPRPGFEWLEASYYVPPPTNEFVILRCRCIEVDRWMHWTAVWDATSGRFALYSGARLIDSAALPGPILTGDPDLGIGRWYQGARSISGVIDDYAIWSRALSADEVAAIDAAAVPDAR